MDGFLAANRALWDELTAIHEGSAFYDVEGFRAGGIRVADHEREVPAGDGAWRLPADAPGELPLMFSILAPKPA